MLKQLNLRVAPNIAADEMGADARTIKAIRIRRRSIDARQRNIYLNLSLDVYINEYPPKLDFEPIHYPDVSDQPRVIVVCAGPG